MIIYIWSKVLKIMRGAAVRGSQIDRTSCVQSGSSFINSTLDRHSFTGYDCTIVNAHIGPFCSLANRVSIGGVAHPLHFISTSPVFLSHKDSVKTKYSRHDYLPQEITEIGADVWIGDGAYLKAGITVGHGAVIGMGAVVTKDVPPYAVVAGNPARVIKSRFDEHTVCRLLATQWWNWSDQKLRRAGQFMNDPEIFLREAESL